MIDRSKCFNDSLWPIKLNMGCWTFSQCFKWKEITYSIFIIHTTPIKGAGLLDGFTLGSLMILSAKQQAKGDLAAET